MVKLRRLITWRIPPCEHARELEQVRRKQQDIERRIKRLEDIRAIRMRTDER